MSDFRLKRTVAVDPDPNRGYEGMLWLEAGTDLDDIPDHEVNQLAPAHFADDDGNEPDDWRTNEATLAHDRRQARNHAAERKARDKERAARRAEKAKAREG